MKIYDSVGEIVPGKMAAGFHIGMDYDFIKEEFLTFFSIKSTDIAENFGTLWKLINKKRNVIKLTHEGAVSEVFIGVDKVYLQFDNDQKIISIIVNSDYKGAYEKTIFTGCKLKCVIENMDLEFNECDDVYFSKDAFSNNGNFLENEMKIGFIADEAEKDYVGEQKINGFWVFS